MKLACYLCQDYHHIQETRLGQRPSRETVSKNSVIEELPADRRKEYAKDD